MGIELGDLVAGDGGAGEVIGFGTGDNVCVRPFPRRDPIEPEIPREEVMLRAGQCTILKKHFEREEGPRGQELER